MKLVRLVPSQNPDKKYDAVIEQDNGREKTVSFGAAGMSDFTLSGSEDSKRRYIARHKVRENWEDPTTSGFWAKHILWNKPTLAESLRSTKTRFNL